MDVGEMFDWMGRIFGIAFLLFMLSVLFFPSMRDPEDEGDDVTAGRAEQKLASQSLPAQPEAESLSGREPEPGTVLTFPVHRRVHR